MDQKRKVLPTGDCVSLHAYLPRILCYKTCSEPILCAVFGNVSLKLTCTSSLLRTKYTDPTGRQRLWESAERQTRPKGSAVDGVGIVAILEDKSEGDGDGEFVSFAWSDMLFSFIAILLR